MDRAGPMALSVAIAAIAGVAFGSCGGADRPLTAPPPTAQQRLALAVVGIDARIGGDRVLGSGFVIDGERGLVATSAHAVWGARSLKLATALGVLHGRVVARAPCDDLALLEVHPRIPGLATLPAAPASSPANGQLLRSLGRRRTESPVESQAIANIPVRVASWGPARHMELPVPNGARSLDSSLVPEVSGGPVVDAAGRLVGMVNVRAAGKRAFTVPWSRIKQRLAELQPGPQRVFVGWVEQYRCASSQQAYAMASHPGYKPSDARLNAPITPTRIPGTSGLNG